MKNVKFLSIILLIAAVQNSFAQNCGYFIPLKTGSGIEMKSYNAGGKPSGSYKQTIQSVTNDGTFTVAGLHIENFDAAGKTVGNNDYSIKCNGTEVIIDGKSLLDPKSMEAYKDMQVTVEATDIEIPSSVEINSTMKDAGVHVNVSNQGKDFSSIDMKITNRKVIAKEKLTVPGGIFDCVKITYDITMEMKTMGYPMTMKMKGVDWFSVNVGTVKTEQYDGNGKLLAYSELAKLF
jgi:hypothetical protein